VSNQPELLGASPGAVKVTGSVSTVLPLEPGPHRAVLASLARKAEAALVRIYLHLENIRGTNDATALNAYLDLPATAKPGEHRERHAGTVGLYGLRRASLPQSETGGAGLTCMLDVTETFLALPAASSIASDELRITVVPNRPLSEDSGLVIGRVALYWQVQSE
jgi:tyrosinase